MLPHNLLGKQFFDLWNRRKISHKIAAEILQSRLSQVLREVEDLQEAIRDVSLSNRVLTESNQQEIESIEAFYDNLLQLTEKMREGSLSEKWLKFAFKRDEEGG